MINKNLNEIGIKIFADGANINDMIVKYKEGMVDGFTTNPTLMAKAGVKDYNEFLKSAVKEMPNTDISVEVFSDEFSEMKEQALKLVSYGKDTIRVKIPITNTRGESSLPLIRELLNEGVRLNVTAILTKEQVDGLREIVNSKDDVIVSVFAGRILDTGRDPMPIMKYTVNIFNGCSHAQILWASTRSIHNVSQAVEAGCDIITMTYDLIAKLPMKGKDLKELSLETVKMFKKDADNAGFRL